MILPTEKETIAYFQMILTQQQMHEIINRYCVENPISKIELLGRSRKQEYVEARHEVANELHMEGFGPSDIGRALNRDHSTIIHYLEDRTPIT